MSYIGTSKVGGMYLGDTKIGKAYLGSELVYENGPVLATPVFSPASGTQFTDSGTITLAADGALAIYYTTDGSTPTTSSTQYTGAITINADATIKAIAVYQEGTSGVAQASYTVVEDKITIDTTVSTTSVTIGGHTFSLDSTTYRPNSTSYYRNIITASQLAAAGVTGKVVDLYFSDNSKVAYFYGGGYTIYSRYDLFGSDTASRTTALKYCDINLAVKQGGDQNASRAFKYIGSGNWGSTSLKVGGEVDGLYKTFDSQVSNYTMSVDISGLRPISNDGFMNVQGAFAKNITTLTIGEYFKVASNATGTSSMFATGTKTSTLKVMSTTPPDISSSSVFDWLSALVAKCASVVIKVPAGCADTYKAAAGWSAYASKISELT